MARRINRRDVLSAVVLGLALTFAGSATSLSLIISEGNSWFLTPILPGRWILLFGASFVLLFAIFIHLSYMKKPKKRA